MEQYNLLRRVELILDFYKSTGRVTPDLIKMVISIRNYYLTKGTITAKQYNAIDSIYKQVEKIIIKQAKYQRP